MQARHRERTQSTITGFVTYPGAGGAIVAAPSSLVFEERVCDDFWKKKRRYFDPNGSGLPPSDLVITDLFRTWTPLQGSRSPTSWFFHGRAANGSSGSNASHISLAGKDKGNVYYTNLLLSRTTPFRPEFSAPVAFKELIDVTTLFKIALGSVVQAVGSTFLNYKFGWEAFRRDIITLSKIVDSVNSRVKEFQSLLEYGGLRRNIGLDSFGGGLSELRQVQSSFSTQIYCRTHKTTRKKIWGSVRWYPKLGKFEKFPTEPAEQFSLAVRQVFDLEEVDPLTAWEMIPFSWLIDYFTNLGSWLGSLEGRTVVTPKDVCIMRETITIEAGTRAPDGSTNDKVSGGDYRVVRTSKERAVVQPSAFPQISFNLLSVDEFIVVLALLARFKL